MIAKSRRFLVLVVASSGVAIGCEGFDLGEGGRHGTSESSPADGSSPPQPAPSSDASTDPSEPSATPSGAWPHEPKGATLINDTAMNALDDNGWSDVYKGFSSSIVKDPTAPLSKDNVLQQRVPQGLVGGTGGGGGSQFTFPPASNRLGEVYWGFWIKTDAAYENHPVMTKISWIHTIDTANEGCVTDNQFFLAISGGGPFDLSANYQNGCIDNSQVPGGGLGTIRVNAGAGGSFAAGTWARIEQYWRPSTTNTAKNGVWKVWLNDNLVVNLSNLNTGRAAAWAVSHVTIWGGTGTTKSRDSFLYFDHEHVSAPNCVASPANCN